VAQGVGPEFKLQYCKEKKQFSDPCTVEYYMFTWAHGLSHRKVKCVARDGRVMKK
jgi:hypothetical protein